MKDTEFRALLDEVSQQLEAFDAYKIKDVVLPHVDKNRLDMGQAEMWKRLEDLFAEGFYHSEPDEHYDLECEACRDLYFGNVHYAVELVERYMSGELSDPVRLLAIAYGNRDRSHSVSASILLAEGIPKLLTAKVEPAITLQKVFNEASAHYGSLREVPLPEKLGEYTLEKGITSEYTLFKQELM